MSSPAQPDWYLGWLEGALRLFPAWEIRAFRHTVANPFFPAVVLPGVTFLLLYLWPFLEARFTGDRNEHHVLDRPRDHPLRTALGASAIAFYAVLLLAGSNDIVAMESQVPVGSVTWVLRILSLALPVVVGVATHRSLRALGRSGAESFLHVPLDAFLRGSRPSPHGQSPVSVRRRLRRGTRDRAGEQ